MGGAEADRHTGRQAAAGLLAEVQRARAHAVRARSLERLVVTPIARGKVDRTAAKRNRGRSNTDSSCSATRVCAITARLETFCCSKTNP